MKKTFTPTAAQLEADFLAAALQGITACPAEYKGVNFIKIAGEYAESLLVLAKERGLIDALEQREQKKQRDYFAAHAPEAIPAWFRQSYTPRFTRPREYTLNDVPREIYDEVNGYFCDACELRTDSGHYWLNKILDSQKAVEDWQRNYDAELFFAWRHYYAAQMLEAGKGAGRE